MFRQPTSSSDVPCEPGSSWRTGCQSSVGSQTCIHVQYNIILFHGFLQHMKEDGVNQQKQPQRAQCDLVVPEGSEEPSRQEDSRRSWVRAAPTQEVS